MFIRFTLYTSFSTLGDGIVCYSLAIGGSRIYSILLRVLAICNRPLSIGSPTSSVGIFIDRGYIKIITMSEAAYLR